MNFRNKRTTFWSRELCNVENLYLLIKILIPSAERHISIMEEDNGNEATEIKVQ
jgi:hypothetical protein